MIRRSAIARRLRKVVVVHTLDGRSLRGVLRESCIDGVVLSSAAYLLERGEEALAGDIIIPIGQVAFIQVATEH